MAVRKTNLSKPTKSSSGLHNKVRFNFGSKGSKGFFAVYTSKRKQIGKETFNRSYDAVAHAMTLQ